MRGLRIITSIILLIYGLSSCTKYEMKANSPDAKTILGHYLFFEKKLSANGTKSCASCHDPAFAFTDGYRKSVSAYGENLLHNAPSLLNISEYKYFDWDNTIITSLELQIHRPLYNTQPREMGLDSNNKNILRYFSNDSLYISLTKKAFPNSASLDFRKIEECITQYVKSLKSMNSKYDQYMSGNKSIFSNKEKNGMQLFFSEKLKCGNCHRPPLFTLANITSTDSIYCNTGMYNVRNQNEYPIDDIGLRRNSQNISDDGKYKIPSLRNAAVTSPYLHDGSVSTLEEMITIYASGGRNITYGINAGDGRKNKMKHPFITGFDISAEEKKDLILFLHTLTDTTYKSDRHFQNPFHN